MLMAKDDPIIGSDTICYEICNRNPYLLLGVTKRGGHLGYFESFLSYKQWFT
jgi:predicted alpha/beta-fold hydrolase